MLLPTFNNLSKVHKYCYFNFGETFCVQLFCLAVAAKSYLKALNWMLFHKNESKEFTEDATGAKISNFAEVFKNYHFKNSIQRQRLKIFFLRFSNQGAICFMSEPAALFNVQQ